MQKIKTLSVTFSEPIAPQELACFRGAISEKVGLEHDFYHNHNNQEDKKSNFYYRYPLIQYHLSNGRPKLLFINDAIVDAQHFFTQADWDLKLAGRTYSSSIHKLESNQVEFGYSTQQVEYQVSRWLGLNSNNHKVFLSSKTLVEKIELIERVLSGHILSLAKSLGYFFPDRFSLYLTDFYKSGLLHYKGVSLLAMDFKFSTNVVLPEGFSLGKGGSLGFGHVVPVVNNNN